MPLVPAKCPNCGATLSVDSNGKAEICQYCGSPFIVEEAKQIFNNTYNIVNNITAENVVVEQVDPQYQSLLQRIKAAVNHNKNTVKSSYLMGSKEFSQYVELYFDKEEFLYNYAILLYYDAVKCDFTFKDDGLIKEFEKVSQSVTSPERKVTLDTYQAEIKENLIIEEPIDEETLQKKYKEDFLNDFENNKSSFDGLMMCYHGHYRVFVFCDNKLYFVHLGDLKEKKGGWPSVSVVSDFYDLCDASPDKLEKNEEIKFIEPRVFKYHAKFEDDYGIERSNVFSGKVSSDKVFFSDEIERWFKMGESYSGIDKLHSTWVSYGWILKGSYEENKETLVEIIRFSSGRCIKCGAPLKTQGMLHKKSICTANCGFSLKWIPGGSYGVYTSEFI